MIRRRKNYNLKKEILSLIPKEERGVLSGDELFFLCPNPDHEDTRPTNCSINLKTGVFYCFACGFSGTITTLRKLKKNSKANNLAFDPLLGKKITKKRENIWR